MQVFKNFATSLLVIGLLMVLVCRSAFANPANKESSTTESSESCEVVTMTNQRLDTLIRRIGTEIEAKPGFWRFSLAKQSVTIITDERADRMRIIIPVAELDGLDEAQLQRLMQANFDSALDARYAIAQKILWSVFIHPLGSLQEKQFLSGVGQVINLAQSFGKSYSSGELLFRGGDSEDLRRKELIDQIIDQGLTI